MRTAIERALLANAERLSTLIVPRETGPMHESAASWTPPAPTRPCLEGRY